jgi:hypothetical protein
VSVFEWSTKLSLFIYRIKNFFYIKWSRLAENLKTGHKYVRFAKVIDFQMFTAYNFSSITKFNVLALDLVAKILGKIELE